MKHKGELLFCALVVLVMASPDAFAAGTGGDEFKDVYDWIRGAMEGYLGRAIALTGGLIGLGVGAAKGSAVPAIVGVVLALFAALGRR